VREFIQFFGSVRQSHGKFLCASMSKCKHEQVKRSCNVGTIMSYVKLTEQELTSP
jgi:hypothetical protein